LPELATYDAAQALEAANLLVAEGEGYVIAHDFTQAFVADASGPAGRALLAGWAADALAAEPKSPSADLALLYAAAGQHAIAFEWARRAVYDAAALGSAPEVQRFLGQALALAPDTRSREQVESILAAFGSGKPLLPTGDASVVQTPPAGTQPLERPAPEERHAEATVPPTAPPIDRYRPWIRLIGLALAGLLVTVLAIRWRRSVMESDPRRSLRDSLLVVERRRERSTFADVITGPLEGISTRPMATVSRSDLPAWVQALQLPWIRPTVSPSGIVAVERMTLAGTDVYLMPDATSAPVPIAVGPGIDAVFGWAPDGQSLLVRRSKALADGSVDADLWAYRIVDRSFTATVIDSSSQRAVEEAAWSPDGSRIAWVARTGPTHQRDVFVSYADGSEVLNVTENPGEDYHISWSPDGSLLGFTSDRDGNPDIFAIDLAANRRLWRLTRTAGEEDYATFSPDNRTVAYQSTAGGDAAVYVMPALGGTPTRVTPPGRQFSILGWRGRPSVSYVDRLRIIGSSTARPGDSVSLSLIGADRDGNPVLPQNASITVVPLDSRAAPVEFQRDSSAPHHYTLRAEHPGIVRVAAAIPGWRSASLTIDVGASGRSQLAEDLGASFDEARWLTLGTPRPIVEKGSAGFRLVPHADLEWQSGILSRDLVSMSEPLALAAIFDAPFHGRPIAAASLTLAVVEDRAILATDSVAPRFAELIGLTWDGETSRFTYSVGSESKSEPAAGITGDSTADVRITMDSTGTILFQVNGKTRWTSSLRFLGIAPATRGRVWIAGRATDAWGAIDRVSVQRRR
jgi:hypothetical protein